MDDLARLRSGRLPVEHNKCPHCLARTHGDRAVPSLLSVVQGFFLGGGGCLFFFLGSHRSITTIGRQLVGMSPPQHHYLTHSRARWNNARALNYTQQSLDQHPPLMAATILNSPSWLSSSLLRCMTLLTMRYSFRLSSSRSRAVRFGVCFFPLPKRVPQINSYSNFGFGGILYCLVRQASGIQTRLHLRVLFPLLCRRSR